MTLNEIMIFAFILLDCFPLTDCNFTVKRLVIAGNASEVLSPFYIMKAEFELILSLSNFSDK